MDKSTAITSCREVAWMARDQASAATAATDVAAAQTWHDVADAADDLAEMLANVQQHIAANR